MVLGTLEREDRRLTLRHDGSWEVFPADPALQRQLETLFNPARESVADGVAGHKTLQDVNTYLGGGYRVVMPERRPGPTDRVAH